MSEPMSDADKIRNKRLAKLSQASASSQQASESQRLNSQVAPEGVATTGQTTSHIPNQDGAAQVATEPPTAQTNASVPSISAHSSSAASRITIAPASVTPQKREMNGSSRPSSRQGITPAARTTETIQQWEDRTLRAAFRLTLDESLAKDGNGHDLYYLANLKEELASENQTPQLNVDLLEQAIMEAGSGLSKTTPHDWLFASWKRIQRLMKGIKDKSLGNKKWEIIADARRLCYNWCILSVATPEIFEAEYDGSKALADHMLADPDDDNGIDHDFTVETTTKWEEDETLASVFVQAFEELSRRLAGLTMDGEYRPYIAIMRRMVGFKPIATAITKSPMFCDKSVPAAELEARTLLGPYFQLSPLQASVTSQYFPGPKSMDQGRIRNAQSSLQMSLRAHQTELSEIVNLMVRASPEARNNVLDWFALALNSNHKRTGIQVDKKTVSSDGFMININACLDTLSEPFIDASFSKIDRAEIEYLRRHPRIDIKDETKINADQEQSDHFYANQTEGQNNFITEVFFLTVAAHHYGLESARKTLTDMDRELKYMEKQITKFEAERSKYIANPVLLQQYERALAKYKDQLDKGLAYKYSIQAILLDKESQTKSMQFMRFTTVWLLRQLSGRTFPQQKISLPFPAQSDAIKCLPEYFIDVISGNFGFILYNLPQIVSSTQSDELIMLCIALLEHSEFIKNPYLKGSLITILFRGTWQYRQGDPGILSNQYNSLPFALDHMLHAIMKFFIEAEFMGGHGQFFDKFNVRFEIFQIIKCIWPNTIYREKLLKEAKVNLDFFVRFVNLLLNDVTFVLDESFTSFHTIHNLTRELEAAGTTLSQEQRQEKDEALEAAKGKAKSYMQLTNETVHMLKLFTEALGDAFTMPEVVQRLADMLDYNLEAMVPPKSSSLKVDNLKEYNFDPRKLLGEIVDVYLNLMNKHNFILAVARDGRSYKPKNFQEARNILQSKALKSTEEIAQWDALLVKFAQAKEEDDAAEADLGEIPDEFLDSLMFSLMEDPVILPTSKNVLDRSTIRSHLLSDPHDPFNRVPLKIEDVIPATDLKEKIEKFKFEKLGAKRGFVETVQTEPSVDADVMDTSV